MRRAAVLPLSLLSCLLLAAHPSGAQTSFDVRNRDGISRNPAGVRLLLRTIEGKLTFHLFDTIPVELEFSSSRPSTYSIEFDEEMNFAGSTHKFEIDPEDAVLLTPSELEIQGVICCESDRHYLSQRPTVFKRELTDYLRFERAGTYRLFLTTRRVFKGPRDSDDFAASKILLTSNILTLTILPDDPEWDAERLAETLQQLHDPHLKADYEALEQEITNMSSETSQDLARANRLDQTKFAQAQKALNALDTREAIRERVNLMDMMSKEDISLEREAGESGGGSVLWQPLLASTTRPDLVVASMAARAAGPDFGVDYDYVDWWAKYIIVRDHTGLFRPFLDEAEHQKRLHSFAEYEIAAKQGIVLRLESLLVAKRGVARDITALTIKTVNAEIAYETKGKGQSPASR